MGIEPMAAHMFILYFGCLSVISPPVAVAAFVAANLAGADPNKTGWMAMAFGWTLFVIPFLFVFSGTLLLKGDPVIIVIDFVTAVAGVWLISAAVMGYSVRPLGIVDRAIHGLIGVCLLLPVGAFAAARWLNDRRRRSRACYCSLWERAHRRAGHASRCAGSDAAAQASRCRPTSAPRSTAWAFAAAATRSDVVALRLRHQPDLAIVPQRAGMKGDVLHRLRHLVRHEQVERREGRLQRRFVLVNAPWSPRRPRSPAR